MKLQKETNWSYRKIQIGQICSPHPVCDGCSAFKYEGNQFKPETNIWSETTKQMYPTVLVVHCWIKVIWISCWCRMYIILGHSIFYIDTVDIYIFWLKYAPSQLKHHCQPHGAFLNIQFGVSIYHVNSEMNEFIYIYIYKLVTTLKPLTVDRINIDCYIMMSPDFDMGQILIVRWPDRWK